jgi:hypothetical protein
MQKENWKNIGDFKNYMKKFDFDPPFWIDPPFLTYLTKFTLDVC